MTEFSLPPFPEHPCDPSQKLAWISWGKSCAAMGMERGAVICEELMGFEEDNPGASAAAAIRAAIQQEPK